MTSAKVLIAGGAAAALVGGGLIVTAAPASACPYGTVPTHFDGVCVSGQGGGSAPVGQLGGAPVASGGGAVFGGGPNELPTVNGIPCTPEKIGTCIGLAQSQG